MSSFPPADSVPRPRLALLAALPFELAGLRSRCEFGSATLANGFRTWQTFLSGLPVLIVETGIGQTRATRATQAVIDAFSPPMLISIGFAGALHPELKSGDLVLAKSVKRTAGRAISCSRPLSREELAGHLGASWRPMITVDAAVTTAQGKADLHESSKGDTVDMESFAVADVCQMRSVKFGGLRVISDDAATNLPVGVMSLIGETGALRMGALVGTLWRKPASVIDLWNLRQQSLTCSDRLAEGCVLLAEWINRAES